MNDARRDLPALGPAASAELCHEGIRSREGRAVALFQMANDLLAVLARDGRFLQMNDAWEQTLGWSLAELHDINAFDLIHPDDLPRTRRLVEGDSGAGPPEVLNFENRYRCRDGGWRRLLWSARTDGEAWYAVAKDITELSSLEHRALHDPLTGLANRALLVDRIGQALARLRRDPRRVTLLFIDLDRFKAVNDGLGHRAGDQLLAEVALRLRDAVRETDTVARLGGDEFIVLTETADEGGALEVAARLHRLFRAPFELGASGPVIVAASIGVAAAADPEVAAEDLIHEADAAMYRAKARADGGYALFDEQMRREMAARLVIEEDLRRAIAQGELLLVYQPVVSLVDETVAGCEALVRWQPPLGPLRMPDEFVALAEENGLIIPIGRWVLEQACRQASAWRRAGHGLTISVNVSPRQLADEDFAAVVRHTLRATGLPAPALCLEVTESTMIGGPQRSVEALQALKRSGVRIAIDDFGRGFSSLGRLRELPVDVIKLDRSFVQGLASRERDDRAIVAAVLGLAEEIGMTVIAEGVETEQQVSALRELGCPYGQGFWWSPARGSDELSLDGFLTRPQPGVGDPFVIREFMRQIGIPARIER